MTSLTKTLKAKPKKKIRRMIHIETPRPNVQANRIGFTVISVHMPEEVRRQLKGIAAEQGRMLADVLGDAFNDYFSKVGYPEIAPVKKSIC